MRRDILKRFLKRHWKKIFLVVVLLISSYKAYSDYARAEERVKEAEEVIIMVWFGPRVRYDMIQEWNRNGIRGWGMWDETTCDEIEKAVEEDELGEEEKQDVLKLLNGGVKLDICAMDIEEFQSAIILMEQIAGREDIHNELGARIEEGEIRVMWRAVHRGRR